MTKKLLILLVLLTASGVTTRGQSTNRLQFPAAGFSIAPLDAPPGPSPRQPLMMFLPATDGLAPNINVQIQPYEGTFDDYTALSLQQFKAEGFKVLQNKTEGKTSALFEYTGEMKGRSLHWYTRVEKHEDKVYLVTATSTEEQWKKVSTQLKTCVDSFQCDAGKKGPASAKPSTR